MTGVTLHDAFVASGCDGIHPALMRVGDRGGAALAVQQGFVDLLLAIALATIYDAEAFMGGTTTLSRSRQPMCQCRNACSRYGPHSMRAT